MEGYASAPARDAREQRVIESLTERVRKVGSGIIHAIGQATEMRSRLLGEREPATLARADGGAKVPTPVSCDIDELRKAIADMEATVELLHGHLNSLARL